MQVFNVFLKILRSKMGMAIMYLGIFLFIGVASANSTKEQGDFTESKAGIVVNDLDDTEASKALYEYLGETNIMSYGNPTDREKLDGAYYNPSRYYLTINKGFGENLTSGETEDILSHTAQEGSYYESLVNSRIELYLTTARAYIASGSDAATALSQAKEALAKKTEVTILTEQGSAYGDTIAPYYQYIPYIFISVFVFALCPVIMVMTSKEIKNRTFSSAISPKRFLLETTLGSLVFMSVIYLFVCIFVPIVIFGCEMTKEIRIAMLNSFAFTIFCAALVLFISNLVESEALISLIGNVVSLGMSFLCGVFVPLQYMDGGVKHVAIFLPAYWYEILNNALAGTAGQVYSDSLAAKCILIQLFFAAALVIATFAVIKAKEAKTGEKIVKPQAVQA